MFMEMSYGALFAQSVWLRKNCGELIISYVGRDNKSLRVNEQAGSGSLLKLDGA